MFTNRYSSVVLLLLAFLWNCATYMPASEGIIYADEEEPYGVKSSLPFNTGEGVTGVTKVILPGKAREAIRQEYEPLGPDSASLEFAEELLTSYPVPVVSVPLAPKAALGFSIFPLFPGLDITTEVLNDLWLTGSVQSPLYQKVNIQLLLQRPFYRVTNGGVSLGLFYKNEHLAIQSKGELVSLFDLFPVDIPMESAGLRVSGQVPDAENRIRLRFMTEVAYTPTYMAPVFGIGISLSLRPRPDRRTNVFIRDPVRY